MSRILIVDDEAYISTQLKERLTSMGYDVVGMASSGEAAIDMTKTLNPDLVLMDIVMPGKLDGIAAAQIIKEEQDIPVIFLTAFAENQFIERAKHVEPFGYIVKPFQEGEIKATIEVALYKKEMEKALQRAHDELEKRIEERTAELAKANEELQAEITERKLAKEALLESERRIAKINECLLSFRPDSYENINQLTRLCGELLGATCALYNRLDKGMLCSMGQWNTPSDYKPIDKPDGHICYDVIQKGGSELFVVRNLPQTQYAKTDPNVKAYGLETYIGMGVKCGGEYVGSLCVVFQRDCVSTQEDERLLGIIASAIGIEEERNRAEEAVKKSEERYRSLYESSKDGIAGGDMEGSILECNQAYSDMLGYTKEEINKLTHQQLTPKRWRKMEADIVKNQIIARGYSDEYEKEYIRKDRTIFPISARVWLRKDEKGEPVGMWGIARDITERKLAEKALREREAELEIKTNSLEEVNTALRVLLRRREEDKTEIEEKVLLNVRELVVPFLGRLKKSQLDPKQLSYTDILESNLNDIISPFSRTLSAKYLSLTPKEIQIANLIKQGKSTKDIGELMVLSPRTIETHRKSLRKKLGLEKKKRNLRSRLLTFQ